MSTCHPWRGGVALFVVSCLVGTIAPARVATAAGEASLEASAANFRPYVLAQIDECLAAVRTLRERIVAADLAGAQRAWLAARGGWESSEVVTTEYFPEFDRAIDAWPDAQRGFHAIESRLFGAHSTDLLPAAEELLGNLTELRRRLSTTTLTAQRLFNGAARLTYEIGEDKAGGGESPFSGNSLTEIGHNVAAIRAVYVRVLAPASKGREARDAAVVASELERLQALVAAGNLAQIDQTALRELSETLASDLIGLGQQIGLNAPSLGN